MCIQRILSIAPCDAVAEWFACSPKKGFPLATGGGGEKTNLKREEEVLLQFLEEHRGINGRTRTTVWKEIARKHLAISGDKICRNYWNGSDRGLLKEFDSGLPIPAHLSTTPTSTPPSLNTYPFLWHAVLLLHVRRKRREVRTLKSHLC
ncbi:hypothetical protein CAPTEDRAFT_186265 [Capitella teleta]|uniref:Myb-like domain-containing protein n=1 Tax=Capitella teleta TaxID=283909 RepID=R7V7Z2_CAPTE|nr:hypothetical protein CAPTEDRAFT_186265 [Capitella teleta]|eukprot:ELU14978.1 hypothetical protein CAPTEDRAFT_186265 [Capitella teleta]